MNNPGRSSALLMNAFRLACGLTLVLIGCGAMQAQQPSSDAAAKRKAKEAFMEGTALQLQGGRHAEAILEFQESLRYVVSPVTLTAMARSYMELGKLDRAEETVRKAIDIDGSYRDGWELLSEVLISSGKYDEGVNAFEHVLELNPTQRQVYTLARLYEPRNAKRAAELYERYVEKTPDTETYIRLANLYKRLREDAKQVVSLEHALELAPTNRRIRAELIETYVKLDRIPDAIAVAGSDPVSRRTAADSEDLWLHMLSEVAADSVLLVEYETDVRTVITETISRFPHSYFPLVAAGDIALRISDVSTAESVFDIATENLPLPSPVDGLLRISYIYLMNDHADKSLAFTLKYHPKYPKEPRFLTAIGDAYGALKQYSQAVTYYQGSVALDPMQIEVWLQLGMQADNAGMDSVSTNAYYEALRIDPRNPMACNNLAYALAVKDASLDTAKTLAWRALQQQPTNAAYLDTYAWVLFRRGEYEKARTYVQQAIQLEGNATHYEHLGDILERLGEYPDAVSAWQRSLELDPERLHLQQKINQHK